MLRGGMSLPSVQYNAYRSSMRLNEQLLLGRSLNYHNTGLMSRNQEEIHDSQGMLNLSRL